MAISEAQKRAANNYKKKNVKRLTIDFYPADQELLVWIESQESKQGYIKELIRRDMEYFKKMNK